MSFLFNFKVLIWDLLTIPLSFGSIHDKAKTGKLIILVIQTNVFYLFGGVPSAFDTTTSIWTNAFSSKSDTPIVLRAGIPPGKNVE